MYIELFLLIISLLFFASIFTDKLSSRFGVPALLLFLGVGMIFGEDGFGIQFDNIYLAQAIGTVSLCVILFSGGMSTKFSQVKSVMKEGVALATIGVLLTWLVTGVLIYYILLWTTHSTSLSLTAALLAAATMSSTDAASVFSILRTRGITLKHNLRPILELESGSNDPMAYILTTTLIGAMTSLDAPTWYGVAGAVLWQMLAGIAVGFLFGRAIVWMMHKVHISNESLYPILILTACIFIFSFTYFFRGNSYLAVYIGGLVIGNSKFAHKRISMNFFDGLSWLSQLTMFLVLGLLVVPHNLLAVIVPGLIVSAVMILVSRPLAVFLTLLPFKNLHWRDKTFLSWVGLKGAVPIIFAIQCLAAQVEGADILFRLAFFCTLVSLILQGTSLGWIAQKLDVALPSQDRKEPTHFDIDFPEEIREQTIEMEVTNQMATEAEGTEIKDVTSLPVGSLVMLIRRKDEYLIPKGNTRVFPGDYLLVVLEDRSALVYAQQEQDWMTDFVNGPKKVIEEWINQRSNQFKHK